MQPPGNHTFYRGNDRILGGVCSGLAEGFHVEALWVRLAFVVLAFLNGVGIALYIVLWVLMPTRVEYQPPGQTVFESMSNDAKRAWADLRAQFRGGAPATTSASVTPTATRPATGTAGAAESAPVGSGEPAPAGPPLPQAAARNPSFIFGAILIAIGIAFLAANTGFVNWSVLWPVALVALGVILLVRNLDKRP
jgi:phage shock protein C